MKSREGKTMVVGDKKTYGIPKKTTGKNLRVLGRRVANKTIN